MRAPRLLAPPRCLWPVGATLGEGPCWSARAQALYFVDILGRRLLRCDAEGRARASWDFDEEISAVAECADGDGLLVSLRHDLALFDPDGGALHRLVRPEPERPGNRFNDGKCDARGRFWAGSTDFACVAPAGALYRYDGDACARVLDGAFISNGPAWSRDGRTLFFNETGRACTYAFAFDPDTGELGERRLWRQWNETEEGAPDGMTVDADGRLWIAHWGGGAVGCYDADSGATLARFELPASNVTSCCFGGAELSTLFVTTARVGLDEAQRQAQPLAGALFALQLDVQGLPANRFAG
ncbi:MAG TPA: SMP-30/gluconolactonase/LRE family protein [Pseudoxanthomonas sp.]|nr:SMP-30/gluconolactonase/LRE family protein [Pseudoxanthomonas sp.]